MNRELINQFNTLIKSLSENDLWDNQMFEYQNLQEESVRAIEMINGNNEIYNIQIQAKGLLMTCSCSVGRDNINFTLI